MPILSGALKVGESSVFSADRRCAIAREAANALRAVRPVPLRSARMPNSAMMPSPMNLSR